MYPNKNPRWIRTPKAKCPSPHRGLPKQQKNNNIPRSVSTGEKTPKWELVEP